MLLPFVVAAMVGLALPSIGCGQEGASCRSSDVCAADLVCKGPSEPTVCGVPPREECASSADCFNGNVCHAIADGCSLDGVGSSCGPPCSGTSCGADFTCGADGACRPTRCDAGATCAAYETCVPPATTGPVHALSSGCSRVACVDDGDCPATTTCTNAFCQAGEGTCEPDIAVP